MPTTDEERDRLWDMIQELANEAWNRGYGDGQGDDEMPYSDREEQLRRDIRSALGFGDDDE